MCERVRSAVSFLTKDGCQKKNVKLFDRVCDPRLNHCEPADTTPHTVGHSEREGTYTLRGAVGG